jgi:adhesin transport system outer membrane protein
MARPRACSSRWRAAGLLAWWPAWALLLGSGVTPPAQAQSVAAVPAATQRAARCIDEDPPTVQPAADPAAAGLGLAAVVQAALAHGRSQSAARLLAEAVALDAEQTRAASQWQLALGARVGGEAARLGGTDTSQPAQASATLSLSRLLWDGGRQQSLLDWRLQLAQASRLAWLSQREQLALSAVMLALDAERHRVQEEVYGQYVRRMACLVDALADVVAVDRGRASELLQARKGVQQAELSLAAARSAHRQTEIRLRRRCCAAARSAPARSASAAAPRARRRAAMASRGMPNTTQLASSWHQVVAAGVAHGRASRGRRRRPCRSASRPVRWGRPRARRDSNSTSTDGLWRLTGSPSRTRAM